MTTPAQQASDIEVEMARTMLRIAADIDRLEDLTDSEPRARIGVNASLVRTAESLRMQVDQLAARTRCPALRQLLEERK